jgi:putative ABC transport system substrate-binding protein
MTGLTAFGSDLGGKRVELLKELIPRLSRVGVLWNPAANTSEPVRMNPAVSVGLEQTEAVARALGVEVRSFPVRRPSDLGNAIEAAAHDRIGALVVEEDSMTYAERPHIIELALANKLPAIYGYRDYVVSGGLISYGAKLPELMHRALEYIDKVLRGGKPRDLPVQQPTKFELVINANTAKALGIAIPQSLLLRADEVIQ